MRLCSAILSSPSTWPVRTIVMSHPCPSHTCTFLSKSLLQHEPVYHQIVLAFHVVSLDCCDAMTLSILPLHISFLVFASAQVCMPPNCPHLPRGLSGLVWRHKPVHLPHAYFFLLVLASAWGYVSPFCPHLSWGLFRLLWLLDPFNLVHASYVSNLRLQHEAVSRICLYLPRGLTGLLWSQEPVHLTHAYFFLSLVFSTSMCATILSFLPLGLIWLLWRHDPVHLTMHIWLLI
jgi:hypothetical protein